MATETQTAQKVECCFLDCTNEAAPYPAYDEDGENRACWDCIEKYEMSDEPLQTESGDDEDDGSCNTCGGSGGGDYPMHCTACGGSGQDRYRSRRGRDEEPDNYVDDYWDPRWEP